MTTPEQHENLRAAFPDHQIGSLPRGGTQLDFVGHAAVTDRLLSVDADWTWEPVAFDSEGAPLVQSKGNRTVMWIRLTVCGTTRLGVGIVEGGKSELEKELISDALRNAAMRFGVALDLWHKGGALNGDSAYSEQQTSEAGPDWSALGWKDEDEHNEAKAEVRVKARGLSDESKEALSAWAESTGLIKGAMPKADVEEWGRQVAALAAGDGPSQEGQ
jgi:hypothetical protein